MFLTLAISFVANGFNLECNFNAETWKYISGETCTTRNLDVTASDQSVTTVNDRTEANVLTRKVKFLCIDSQVVKFVPSGLNIFFPNIIELKISNSSLQFIEKKNLAQFTNLKYLDLSGNELKTLDDDLFSANVMLRDINFNKNKLNAVGENILEPLKNAFKIDFGDNVCINKEATGEAEIQELKHQLAEKCPLPSHFGIFLSAIIIFMVLVVIAWLIHCVVRKNNN